jgi:hypothetical protein
MSNVKLQLTKETVIIRSIPNAAAIPPGMVHGMLPGGTNMFDKEREIARRQEKT